MISVYEVITSSLTVAAGVFLIIEALLFFDREPNENLPADHKWAVQMAALCGAGWFCFLSALVAIVDLMEFVG